MFKFLKCFIFVLFLNFAGLSFAQDAQNLNLGDISIDTETLSQYGQDMGKNSLYSYFLCKASAENDVCYCNYLWPDGKEMCRKCFYLYHKFFADLVYAGNVSSEAIKACVNVGYGTLEGCQKEAEAFIKKDVSLLLKDKDKAVVLRDERKCGGSKTCKNIIRYVKAVEGRNQGLCNALEDEGLRLLCQQEVAMDKNICEQCDAYKRFRQSFIKKMGEN